MTGSFPASTGDAGPAGAAPEGSGPLIRPRAEHSISRRDIDPDALKVLYHLSQRGYVAYLVGGGVRDLLLGRRPKDFDVGTDAHPRTIKRLFRNCFLIGRRFRLAHIKFGAKIIETSTFRRDPERLSGDEAQGLYHHRDNTFGTPEEDARRRDFTINGLFYDIRTFSVIDYVGGLADLQRGVVRSIGDPNIRFCEDPVRMIRAARFAARLGFTIEPETFEAVRRHRAEIAKASPPRLLEEIYRLFAFHTGERALRLLRETGLMETLFPEIERYLQGNAGADDGYWRYLRALDRHGAGKDDPPPPALLFGVLLYPLFLGLIGAAGQTGEHAHHGEVIHRLLEPLAPRFSMPKHVFFRVIRIVEGQRRFEHPLRHVHRMRFAAHEDFGDALALRRVHLEATGADLGSLEAWEALHAQHAGKARAHSPDRQDRGGGRRRRPRRGRGRRSWHPPHGPHVPPHAPAARPRTGHVGA